MLPKEHDDTIANCHSHREHLFRDDWRLAHRLRVCGLFLVFGFILLADFEFSRLIDFLVRTRPNG